MSQSTLHDTAERPDAAPESPFPLRVAAFEEMLIADDRVAYPMVSCKELLFSGRMDRDALQRSIESSIARHPLLSALIRRDRRLGLIWVRADRRPEIDWGPLDAAIDGVREYVDLGREVGIKFWVRLGDAETRIVIRMHHACCDGFGALQLLEDIFAAYIATTAGRSHPDWRELQPELLARRGDFSDLRREADQLSAGRKLRDAVRFLLQKPSPLAAPNEPSGSAVAYDGYTNRDLGSDILRGLRRSAATRQVTLNDVLLRDLFVTLRNWNRQHAPARQGKWLRILMPCNLRDTEFQSMPAANRMGYAFVTRSIANCDQPDELLHSVGAETKRILGQCRSLDWTRGLEIAQASRFGLSWMTRSNRCFCTVVLSNLGDPLRAFTPQALRQRGKLQLGDVTLEQIAAYTPLRPKTHAGFLVTTYAGRLAISMTCDPYLFSADSASSLMDEFSSQLEATADVTAESTT